MINAFDYLTADERTAVETNSWSVVPNVNASLQDALNEAAGSRLVMPEGRYRVTSPLNFPSYSEIEGEGAVIQGHVSDANLATTTSKTHIRISKVGFESAGSFSMAMNFALCDWVELDRVIFNGALGSNLSYIFLRSYGSTRVKVRGGEFYDCDNPIYLDKSGAVLSDDVHVSDSHFEHRFPGSTSNPVGVYAYNCGTLQVDGNCTALNIAAGGSSPIAGYFVYEGDGQCDSLTVRDCESRMTVAKPHVMVQASNSLKCKVRENHFTGYALVTEGANYLFNGGGAGSVLTVEGNYSKNGSVFVTGGASLTNATKLARVNRNTFDGVDQNVCPIRFGVLGANYVSDAECFDNFSDGSRAAGIAFSQVSKIRGGGNRIRNWNAANYSTHNVYAYTSGIYIDGTPAGTLKGDVLDAGTYGRVGIAASSSSHAVRISGAEISGVLDASMVNSNNGYLTASIAPASAVSLASNTGKTILSLAISSGEWEIDGLVGYLPDATTNVLGFGFGASTTNNTYGAEGTYGTDYNAPAGIVYGAVGIRRSIPRQRITGPATAYLIGSAVFSGSVAAFGKLSATLKR